MSIKYLALGDSYTIGEAVPPEQSFPFQLAGGLRAVGTDIDDPMIIAQTGWTTDELMQAIKTENPLGKYDLVTLLIGVNNQYRGYSEQNYRLEFIELLKTAVSFADNSSENVYVVSIPDWGVTPFARKSGRETAKISSEIDAFNNVSKEEAIKMNVSYVDITACSRAASADPALLAHDGLHPSGKMYAQWIEQIIREVVTTP